MLTRRLLQQCPHRGALQYRLQFRAFLQQQRHLFPSVHHCTATTNKQFHSSRSCATPPSVRVSVIGPPPGMKTSRLQWISTSMARVVWPVQDCYQEECHHFKKTAIAQFAYCGTMYKHAPKMMERNLGNL